MTTHGKGVPIQKKQRPLIKDWTTFHFVDYFYDKATEAHGFLITDRDIDKDCTIMKRIVDYYLENDYNKRVAKTFIDWAVDKYVNKNSFTVPVTLGYISFWKEEYIGKKFEEREKKKKKKLEDKPLPPEEADWVSQWASMYRKEKRSRRK